MATDRDPRAGDELARRVEEEMRRVAAREMRKERPDHTLTPTGLVNEVYMKLVDAANVDWKGRSHFMAVATLKMRRVLVNHAKRRTRQKRGAGSKPGPLLGVEPALELNLDDILDIDAALGQLESLDERQARVVVLRYFGNMTVEETAEALGVSPRTVKNDHRFAVAWLSRRLGR